MVERSWNGEGGEIRHVSTSEMVPLANGMLHRSKLFRTKD